MEVLLNVVSVVALTGIVCQVVGMPLMGALVGGLTALGMGDALAHGGQSALTPERNRVTGQGEATPGTKERRPAA